VLIKWMTEKPCITRSSTGIEFSDAAVEETKEVSEGGETAFRLGEASRREKHHGPTYIRRSIRLRGD
jgi:hypothetical protein